MKKSDYDIKKLMMQKLERRTAGRLFHFFIIIEIRNARGTMGWDSGKNFGSQNVFPL